MKPYRLARVAETVREVAAETILFELKDPRVKNVTVTRAEVSADLQQAKVYVSVMGTEKEQQLSMHGLQHAAGFVQTRLAKRLTTRFVPHVEFVLDPGVKKSLEIARILREEKERAGAPDGATPEPGEPTDDEQDVDESEEPATPTVPTLPGATAAEGSADKPDGSS